MSDFETLQRWIAERTFHSPDYRNNKIIIGDLDLSLQWQRDQAGRNNPLNIILHSYPGESKQVLFSVPLRYGSSRLGSIKKISDTPFYHAYIIYSTLIIDIIDFFNWGQHPEIYRLFLIHYPDPAFELILSFPGTDRPLAVRPNVFQISKFFWSAHANVEFNAAEQGLILKPMLISDRSAIGVITISQSDIQSTDNSVEHGLSLLMSLSQRASSHHIKNTYYVNDCVLQNRLDELWTAQKALTPDWKVAETILNDPVHHQVILTWIIELALYFSNRDLSGDIYAALQQKFDLVKMSPRLLLLHSRLQDYLAEKGRQHAGAVSIPLGEVDEPFQACMLQDGQPGDETRKWSEDQLLYRSYFSEVNDDPATCDFVQRYWSRISLPLFERKLERALKADPEKIIILCLMGLYYDLPFGEILATQIEQQVDEPFFILIVFLQRLVQKRYHGNSLYSFKQGSREEYAVKEVKLFDTGSLRFTSYGKVSYVQFTSNDNFHFRMDKMIHCFVDCARKKIGVYPAVPFYPMRESSDKRMEVQIADYLVSWPFLWSKAEIVSAGIRFRWIFKKRRYQVTIKRKKGKGPLKIDDRVIEWPDSNRVIRYYEVNGIDPEIGLHVLDGHGRYVPMEKKSSQCKIYLVGWIKNRYNQFQEKFTYRYNNSQHGAGGAGHYGIQTVIHIPAMTEMLTFSIKGRQEVFKIPYFVHPFWEKLFSYSLGAGHGYLVVLIDSDLKAHFHYIQTFFDDYFAFQARYLIKNPGVLPVPCSLMIYIKASGKDMVIRHNQELTATPYLEIGVKHGIEQLKHLDHFIENNLYSVDAGEIKR
jgi:hypothetical protein